MTCSKNDQIQLLARHLVSLVPYVSSEPKIKGLYALFDATVG
jgi:hypothetical protein